MTASCERHPEEVECFRMPIPDGRFSRDKRYEYTYATRKSFEYIPSLGRQDWRYFTTKPFIYAGKWLRSESRGFGDGGENWEVFHDPDPNPDSDPNPDGSHDEKIISWDYDGTLCWRESPYSDSDTTIRKIMNDIIEDVVVGEKREEKIQQNTNTLKSEVSPKIDTAPAIHEEEQSSSSSSSILRFILGKPSTCGMLDPAETTTMESKYNIHPNIAEFWCFITSFFYGTSLLLYFVKQENWYEKWREDAGWPDFIHFSILCSVFVMICSAVYHSTLFEIAGCMDCFLASFIVASVTMSCFGIDMLTQIGFLLGLGVINMMMWRHSTRIALIVVGFIYPFVILVCTRMKWYYGQIIFSLISLGIVCFLLDRLGYAPLHSLWHILGGAAITLSLYHVVINGPV